MSERVFVKSDGKLIGVYIDTPEDFVPPAGATEVPTAPTDGRQKWDGEKWIALDEATAAKDTILVLEAQITPRRLREAVLGADGGWLLEQEAKIAKLREGI